MSRQLNSCIAAKSGWRLLYATTFLAVPVLLIVTTLVTWAGIMVLLLSSALLAMVFYVHDTPLHISVSDCDDMTKGWQLLYKAGANAKAAGAAPVLWEAKLVSANALRHCLQLSFVTHYPIVQKKTVVLWQDQVQADTWRRLMVLAQWR